MQSPEIPADEAARIDALSALNILDTPLEERFDRLTRLARRLFGVPIALVSLVDADRQWFKSRQGLDATQTSRDISFCGHAILGHDILLVPDAALDARFNDNPLVTDAPHIRFYAGCPLRAADGSKLGTLCIIDRQPRALDEEEKALLRDLAKMVEVELNAVQLATMDDLTSLSNRRGFELLAQHALGQCRRLAKPASLLFVDLDGFKQINDRFGHAEGDRALMNFAELLKQTFRESDVIGRLGGDEFAVLLTQIGNDEVGYVMARLQEAVEARNRTVQSGYDLRYSFGVLEFDSARHASLAALMAQADALMYEQKQRRAALRDPVLTSGNDERVAA